MSNSENNPPSSRDSISGRPNRGFDELGMTEIKRQVNHAKQVLKHARSEYERKNGKLDVPAWMIAGVDFLVDYIAEVSTSPEMIAELLAKADDHIVGLGLDEITKKFL